MTVVAFALQGDPGPVPVMSYAQLMVNAIRKNMPGARLVQLSNMLFPKIDNVDILRSPNHGDFIKWAWNAGKSLFESFPTSNILTIGTDMIVRRDVSDVFEQDFDVALSPYPMRTRTDGAYCGDGIFWKPSGFGLLAEALRIYESDKSLQDGWEGSQTALLQAIRSGKWKVLSLDFDTYNFTPDEPGMDVSKASIVHYRGLRKRFMAQDHGGEPFPLQIVGFESSLNTPVSVMLEQAGLNLARDYPLFVECPPNGNKALIVGGGPSLARMLPNLRMHRNYGGIVFALNGTHDYLIDKGIVPDFHVMLDARAENVRFVQKPHKDVTYLIAAQCHPAVFEALAGFDVIMWVSCMDYGEQELADKFKGKPIVLVGGGATVGLKTMFLAYLSGFRNFHFYGFDSSYEGEENHAYKQELNAKESRIDVTAAGRTFVCAPWMAKQAQEFQGQMRKLIDLGCEFNVHGDGLIPWICKQWELEAA